MRLRIWAAVSSSWFSSTLATDITVGKNACLSSSGSSDSETVFDGQPKLGTLLLSKHQDVQRAVSVPHEANHSMSSLGSSNFIGKTTIVSWFAGVARSQASSFLRTPANSTKARNSWSIMIIELEERFLRILHAVKTNGGSWLSKSLLMFRSKATDPIYRWWLIAICVVVVCSCIGIVNARRRQQVRTHRKRKLDDDTLGYLFKAKRLEQTRSQSR